MPALDTLTGRDMLSVVVSVLARTCVRLHTHICIYAYDCDCSDRHGERESNCSGLNKGESTAVGGIRRWGEAPRPRVLVFVTNVAAAVVFDAPPSWLTDCGRVELSVLLTLHGSAVDLMFADSLSHCCYNDPWVVREGRGKKERS